MSTATTSEAKTKKAKKKVEIEMKMLEFEFERKRPDHSEQMRQLEEKSQIKMQEAELETSSGWKSDGSKPSSESESEVQKRSMAARSLKSDKWDEFAENMRVSLPQQDLFLFAKTQQCSSDEDYKNPFE